MKLAEALLLRADMQKKLAGLRERVAANALVQEGNKPHEDPEALLREALRVADELTKLMARINRANMRDALADGRTLMEAVLDREALKAQHAITLEAARTTKREPDRYSMREIKWVAQLDVSRLQKEADKLSERIRELNGKIQEANWNTELGD